MVEQYFLENLAHLIELNNLNQLKLSKLISIPQGTINNWYRRKSIPNAETLEDLAKYFGVEPHYFFMKPGTQNGKKATDRFDDFETLIDELAEKNLRPVEIEAYKKSGGANAFVKYLRENFETDNIINMADWFLKLQSELHKYTSVSIVEKAQRRAAKLQGDKKKQVNGKD